MRLAVIGAGFAEQHLAWLRDIENVSIPVICYATDRTRASALAKRFDVPEVSDDAVGVIRDAAIDGVVIVSPPRSHEELVLAALERNLTVICDKPLAHTVNSATSLAHAAQRSSSHSVMMFQWRLHPLLRSVKALLDGGEVGELKHVSLGFRHDFLAMEETLWPWRHKRQEGGAGALSDIGVHLFDLLRFLAPGSWHVVAGNAQTAWPVRRYRGKNLACDTEDAADLLMEQTDASRFANLTLSRVATGVHEMSGALTGSRASLDFSIDLDTARGSIMLRRPDKHSEKTLFDRSNFNPYSFLLPGSNIQVSNFTDGLIAQQLMADAIEIFETGR
ncbi:Gfo/Idh/MocA family protein [Sphingomonas sanguinis]|uniref:Gfo/Idh/MocA family protein n=1 Tax=Sphingomonas sanguinis TaxID=33051 RepID=UPI0009EC1F83|nr:Gfo/Idh/MocA family oxidoreductase [Sphingomonas sanguinis]